MLEVWPIVGVNAEVLFLCLHNLFAKSLCLWVADSGGVEVDIDLLIDLFKELSCELPTTIGSYMTRLPTQSPDVIDIGIGNVFCCLSHFGWNLRLYSGKPVCDN